LDKTRLRKIAFATEWPPQIHAEGSQVEPVLARSLLEILLLDSKEGLSS
jgi:hypothetical protein